MKKRKIKDVATLIVTLFLIFGYITFIKDAYTVTFSGYLSITFFLYILAFSPLLLIPYFIIKLYNKWGRFYFLYMFFIVFYSITFFIFVKTINYREKYHFFDPFLQINPVLNNELLIPKADNEIRILMLGGSTTRCERLPSFQKYSALLERRLSLYYPHKKITVFNAAMDWFTTRHSLIVYTNYYKPFHADVVIIMHAVNDLIRSFTPLNMASNSFKFDYSHFYGPSSYAAFPQKTYPERLMNIIQNFYNTAILNKKDIYVDFDSSSYISANSYKYFYPLLINEIYRDGSLPIIVSEPFIYNNKMSKDEISNLWFAKEYCYNQRDNDYKPFGKHMASSVSLMNAMNYFNKISEKIAEKHHIPFINLEAVMPKNSNFFVDDVHFTGKGSEKAAEFVAGFLIKNKILEKK